MTGDRQMLALLVFSGFVAVTLAITTWVSRSRHGSAEEFYVGGRLFTPLENGCAIAGDYTVTSAEVPDEAKYAETEVRSLTGAGAV